MTNNVHAVKGGLLLYCAKIYSRGNINQKHRIGDVMVSVLVGSSPGRVKPKTIQLVCVASPLSTQHYGERANWLARNQKSLKIPKAQSETVYRRRTDNTMAKRKSTKGQTMIDKTYK